MATISITVASFTASKTISGADALRLLAAYRTLYGQVPSGPADPVTHIVPMRDMTDQECFDKFAAGMLAGIVDNVKKAEQQVQVITPIVPITLT